MNFASEDQMRNLPDLPKRPQQPPSLPQSIPDGNTVNGPNGVNKLIEY